MPELSAQQKLRCDKRDSFASRSLAQRAEKSKRGTLDHGVARCNADCLRLHRSKGRLSRCPRRFDRFGLAFRPGHEMGSRGRRQQVPRFVWGWASCYQKASGG